MSETKESREQLTEEIIELMNRDLERQAEVNRQYWPCRPIQNLEDVRAFYPSFYNVMKKAEEEANERTR